MKVLSLSLITISGLLAFTVPASAHVLPLHNFVDDSSVNDTPSGENGSNSTQTDLGMFNGTWYVISMEQDIYKEMQKVARKYNTSCTCPQMTLTPAGPAALDANASCTLQTDGSSTQVLSHGLLTLLPSRRSGNNDMTMKQTATNNTTSTSQVYSFALLFSRLYIDSNDTTFINNGNQSDQLPNLSQGIQLPRMDSGVKGSLFWSFFSSKNGSSPDDVAFVRSKHMISGDNKHDIPDVNMLLSKSQTLFDDAIYNETAPTIPGIGKDYKWDYVKLDKCNTTSSSGGDGGQQPEATSTTDQPAQASETSDQATSTASDQQPQSTTTTPPPPSSTQGDQGQSTSDDGQQQQPTEATDGGDQQQPTETSSNGDQQQPQPSETNSGSG